MIPVGACYRKAYVWSDDLMDFLQDIVKTAPNLTSEERREVHRAKRQRWEILQTFQQTLWLSSSKVV